MYVTKFVQPYERISLRFSESMEMEIKGMERKRTLMIVPVKNIPLSANVHEKRILLSI